MEKLFTGRAITNDTFDSIEIEIPTKKNWFTILFMGVWLGGWSMGEMSAINTLFVSNDGLGSGNYFMMFWLFGWTIGGSGSMLFHR